MLQVNNVSYKYDNLQVLADINLQIPTGSFVAILGESGCGKSTLLKIIYGLLDLEKGTVFWKDHQVLGPAFYLVPGMPYMKYLSQDFNLMAYTTVEENVSQYLSVFFPEELKERTQELLNMIELTEYAHKKVATLSGGQQQRVALARVLAQKPEVLLLDEPFSHIDDFLKGDLRRNIFRYLKEHKITCIVATHDKSDVLPFMDTAVILRNHTVLAKDSPINLYRNPKSLYVASLFGEANSIALKLLVPTTSKTQHIIIYANEFKVRTKNGFPVSVEHAYPMGSYYLIAGTTKTGQTLFFHNTQELLKDDEVCLSVTTELIEKRSC